MLEEPLHKIDLHNTSTAGTAKNINTSEIEKRPDINFNNTHSTTKTMSKPILYLLVVLLGIGSGYFAHTRLARNTVITPNASGEIQSSVPGSGLKVGEIYGAPKAVEFKDTAVGTLDRGGFNGEGSHKLLREGGKSQTVYLTSSTVDLDQFVGAKVTVWGQTFSAQKAGWLMDVGRVKVEQLNAPLPSGD